jgi:hypothetical protein
VNGLPATETVNLRFPADWTRPSRGSCQIAGCVGEVFPLLTRTFQAGSRDWLKFKNPEAPAVKREAEEDWGR